MENMLTLCGSKFVFHETAVFVVMTRISRNIRRVVAVLGVTLVWYGVI